MALQELHWKKAAPRHHVIRYVDDVAGDRTIRVVVPEELPEEYANAREYIYDQLKQAILNQRAKVQRRLDRIAEEQANWSSTTDEESTVVDQALTMLQSDID